MRSKNLKDSERFQKILKILRLGVKSSVRVPGLVEELHRVGPKQTKTNGGLTFQPAPEALEKRVVLWLAAMRTHPAQVRILRDKTHHLR